MRGRHFASQRVRIRRPLEFGCTRLERRHERRQLGWRNASLPSRRVQRLDARFRLAQRLRIEVEARCVVAQRARRLARLRVRRVEQFDDRFERGVVRTEHP